MKNSNGTRKAYELTVFLGVPGLMFAEVRAEYTAATGAKTFSDHDIGIFRAMSQSGDKQADGRTKFT
ncbi:MAG: hypothetical protein KY444_02125 [Gemmatimonadetes bacterium]|nr:hypothetical protein [Gemmatimonadota bacterium]